MGVRVAGLHVIAATTLSGGKGGQVSGGFEGINTGENGRLRLAVRSLIAGGRVYYR